MKIKKTNFINNLEHKPNRDSISTILDEIFLVCSSDNKIFNNEKLKKEDEKIKVLNKKTGKQKSLLKDSVELEKQLNEKIKQLENVIESKRITLIERIDNYEN